jgi:hypothetical protein
MKRLILTIFTTTAIGMLLAAGVLAAVPAKVTVRVLAAPVAIGNSPNAWRINGITGNGVISTNTTYYSNPRGDTVPPAATVADGDCFFTLTNNSTNEIQLIVTMTDFTGGDAMTNCGTGSANATGFGGYAWASGVNYASGKQVLLKTNSIPIDNALSPFSSIKWGLTLSTRTNDWTSGTAETATVTITAALAAP